MKLPGVLLTLLVSLGAAAAPARASEPTHDVSFELRAQRDVLWLRGESGRTMTLGPHDTAHVRWDSARRSWLVQINGKLPNFVQQKLEVGYGTHVAPKTWHAVNAQAMAKADRRSQISGLHDAGVSISSIKVTPIKRSPPPATPQPEISSHSVTPSNKTAETEQPSERRGLRKVELSPTQRAALNLRRLENFASGGLKTEQAVRALSRLTRRKVGVMQQLRQQLLGRAVDMFARDLISHSTYRRLAKTIAANEQVAKSGALNSYVTSTHELNGLRKLGVQIAPKRLAGALQKESRVLGQVRHHGATYRLWKLARTPRARRRPRR